MEFITIEVVDVKVGDYVKLTTDEISASFTVGYVSFDFIESESREVILKTSTIKTIDRVKATYKLPTIPGIYHIQGQEFVYFLSSMGKWRSLYRSSTTSSAIAKYFMDTEAKLERLIPESQISQNL